MLLERGGQLWLGDAKWSELPRPADATRLRQVAGLLPAGSVSAQALLCRAPHRFPLGDGVDALPLEELASVWGLTDQAAGGSTSSSTAVQRSRSRSPR